jgi:hypothetical protein
MIEKKQKTANLAKIHSNYMVQKNLVTYKPLIILMLYSKMFINFIQIANLITYFAYFLNRHDFPFSDVH